MDNEKVRKSNSLVPGIILCLTLTVILIVHCLFTTYAVGTIECNREPKNNYCVITDKGINKNRFEKILIASIKGAHLETKDLRNMSVSRVVLETKTEQVIPVNSSFSSDEFAHMEVINDINTFLKEKEQKHLKFVDDSRMDAIKRTAMGIMFIALVVAIIMLIKFRKKLFKLG